MRRFFRKLNLNKRKIWSVGLIAIIFVMSLGYAALSQHMDIDGITVIDRNWVVKITGTAKSITGNVTENHTYVSNTVTMNVTLPDTSSKVQYSIQIANLGNLVAKLSNIEIIEDDNSSIVYEITGVEEGELIKPNNYDVAVVTIKYADGVTNVGNTEKSIMISFNYVEDVGNSIQGDGYVTVTGQKEYSIGEEVTLVDGSRWYVVEDSGSDEELVTLFAATSDMTCTQFDTTTTYYYNPTSTTNIGYCLNNTYLPNLKTSLNNAGGNTKGMAIRLLTYKEHENFVNKNSTPIQVDKTGQTTWLMPNGNVLMLTASNKVSPVGTSMVRGAARPVITILKSNILTTLADKILADNTEQSDSNIDFSLPSYYPLYGEDVTPTNYTYSHTYSSTANVIYGTGYTFDEKTGKYTLTNTTMVTLGSQSVANSFFSSTYKYTCLISAVTSCSTIYELAIVSSITSTEAKIIYYKWTSVLTGSYGSTNGLYYTSTNTERNLPTYYFRGNVTNNYVSFAGNTWRIVRINEDGSIRLIRQEAIGTSAFNSTSVMNSYVGYMYGTPAANSYAEAHANINDSTIKTNLDAWYLSNLSRYSEYISTEAGFCNDRSISSGLGYGENTTYYGVYNRIYNTYQPQFKCSQSNDLFTTGLSYKGNNDLLYPIGLLTADEAMYAGGKYFNTSSNYYLLNGTTWWTMTPYYVIYGSTTGLAVSNGSDIGNYSVASTSYGVRPVINLSPGASVVSGGTGTSSNPYVIKTNTDTSLAQQILSNNSPQPDNQPSQYVDGSTGIDFSETNSDTNGKGLYYTSKNTENNLTTYYFRGAVENNYVSFASKIWRIVRINEDGSVRLMLNSSVGNSGYNSQTDNAHIGYMFGTIGATSYSDAHANTNNSTIKTYLDNWYTNNLNSYTNLLGDAGFCNDRSKNSTAGVWDADDTALGYGTNVTYYASRYRTQVTKKPQFLCPQSSDLFTMTSIYSFRGNAKLTKPIGLITIDELVFAGMAYNVENTTTYTYIGDTYHTMSPINFDLSTSGNLRPFMWIVNENNKFTGLSASASRGVRPVISLNNGVKITSGNGTSTSPYVIKTS